MYKIFKKMSCLTLAVVLFISLFAGIDMKVSAATQRESESNDTYATADSITLGNTMKGNLKVKNDEDYYKFTPTANGKLEINFLHTYEDNSYVGWDIDVYLYEDGEYNLLLEKFVKIKENEKIAFPNLGVVKGKTYYIHVYGYYYELEGVEYGISTKLVPSEYYEKEFNDIYRTATFMTLGKEYSGNLKVKNDEDYYKFTPTANGKLEINFLHTYEDNSYVGWDIDIYLYEDGEYNLLLEESVKIKGNEKIAFPNLGVVKGKTYYIHVYGYYYELEGVEYGISTKLISSEYYEKEFNDKYREATLISLGKTYKGNMKDSRDADYYKVISPATGNIQVKFEHPYEDDEDYWYIYIYQYKNGEYKQLCYDDISLDSNRSITLPSIQAIAGGIYYIVVDCGYSEDAIIGKEYTLKASYLLSNVSNVKATPKKKAIKLSWKKQSGITYQVQIKDGKWKTAKTTTGNKCTIKKLKAKKTYKVRIRGYKKVNGVIYYSAWKTVKVKTK